MMALDLNGFSIFAAVVDAGGFTAAARRLRVSKSAVSRQVSALEEQLGTRLLNRTTRRLSPTEAGLAIYERASRIVAEAEAAELTVNDLARAPRGRLRLNAPMSFGHRRLGPALAAFAAAYPDIGIEISINDRVVDLVEEGFDVAVRIGTLESSSLIARKLCPVGVVIAASPAYLKTAPPLDVPADLGNHRCLVYELRRRPTEWVFRDAAGVAVTVNVDPAVLANNGEILASMAAAGAGVIYLPDFVVDEALASGHLRRVLHGFRGDEIGVHAVYPAVRHLATKVRVFVDFLADWFQSDRALGRH